MKPLVRIKTITKLIFEVSAQEYSRPFSHEMYEWCLLFYFFKHLSFVSFIYIIYGMRVVRCNSAKYVWKVICDEKDFEPTCSAVAFYPSYPFWLLYHLFACFKNASCYLLFQIFVSTFIFTILAEGNEGHNVFPTVILFSFRGGNILWMIKSQTQKNCRTFR